MNACILRYDGLNGIIGSLTIPDRYCYDAAILAGNEVEDYVNTDYHG